MKLSVKYVLDKVWPNRLVDGYNFASLNLTPVTFIADTEARYNREMEMRVRDYIVPQLNLLSEDSKNTLFGDYCHEVKPGDVSFEFLEKALCPMLIEGAVFRENGLLPNSKHNKIFANTSSEDISLSEKFYPRTIVVYDTEKRAKAACEVLKILAHGSNAEVVYEELDHLLLKNGVMLENVHTVSDNMKLNVHNHIRCLEKYLSRQVDDSGIIKYLKSDIQEKVDKILKLTYFDGVETKDREWIAWTGITTHSTVCGSPGIKMFADKYNPKTEKFEPLEKDIKIIKSMAVQTNPVFVNGVKESIMAADDGRYFEMQGGWFENLVEKIRGKEAALRAMHIGRA